MSKMDPQIVSALQALANAGPALIFAVLWWLERQERKDLSSKLIESLKSMAATNDAWLKILNKK